MTTSGTAAEVIEKLLSRGELDVEAIERELEEIDLDRPTDTKETAQGFQRPSIYVEAFEEMINVVHERERHLLTEAEWEVIGRFAGLCYNARYCLVRLVLRKSDKWHTFSSMEKFKREVGEEGLMSSIEDLCQRFNSPAKEEPIDTDMLVKKEEQEIIDLTFAEDLGETKRPLLPGVEALPPWISNDTHPPDDVKLDAKPAVENILNPTIATPTSDMGYFMENETCLTLAELLPELKVDQLKILIRATKLKPINATKPQMISSLLYHASTQTVLSFPIRNKPRSGGTKGDGLRQTQLPFLKLGTKSQQLLETQEKRLREMALNQLGKCVRVNHDFHKLILRINIAYDRANTYPKSLLTPAILTMLKKRVYPDYKYCRDGTIWPTRAEFLAYVEALEFDAAVDHTLESSNSNRSTQAPVLENQRKFTTPLNGRSSRILSTPIRTPGSSTVRSTPTSVKNEIPENQQPEVSCDDDPEESIKMKKARRVKEFFSEVLFPMWQDLLAAKLLQEARKRTPGLERFEAGYVYTRMLSKVTQALASLEDYEAEAKLLESLLAQRLWRRGKRGKWYDRRALLFTRYLCRLDDKKKDEGILHQAMKGIQEALEDEDTGIVLRPKLIRRLRALEKALKVPEDQRCRYEGDLRKAEVVSFTAVRLWAAQTGLELDGSGRPKSKGKENGSSLINDTTVRHYFPPLPGKHSSESKDSFIKMEIKSKGRTGSEGWKWKGKSLWMGRDRDSVNVETRALQFYEDNGYKGFHSESSILTTIFALLFWDIIFTDVPGAFETPFQDRPLDMAEDAFYYARQDLIEARLAELEQGMTSAILERHDDANRERNTWCVGVQWDVCGKQDLLEIVECLGGSTLAIICRLFCEDYRGRSSGVPDLVVWDYAKRLCKFVEVKGPGDTPQENQKLWFDTLLGAGANVEVCKIVDVNAVDTKKTPRQTKRTNKSKVENMEQIMEDSNLEVESEEEQFDFFEQRRSPRKRGRPLDALPIVSTTLAASSGLLSTHDEDQPNKKRRITVEMSTS